MPGLPTSRRERLLLTAVLVLAAMALCAPMLLHEHLPLGSDVYVTHHYARGFQTALEEGVLYPRWLAATNQGLGAPVFVYYPPLPWYGVALLAKLTGSLDAAFRAYFVIVSFMTAIAFYRLARQWAGPGIPSALAAALYLLLPYHALDLYHRFALSETTAFLFLPLVLLHARRSILVGRFADYLMLSLSWAGLLFTHVVTAVPFALLLVPWLVLEGRRRPAALARSIAALAAGTLLAAPVILPLAMERGLVNVAWYRQMPNGDFRINFLFRDEVLPGLGIRDPVKPPAFRAAHAQLILGIVAAALGLAWTARGQERRRRDLVTMAAWGGAAYLMQLPLSTPIWLAVPMLATIQFPWRFQTQMVLAVSLLFAWALSAGWGRAGGSAARERGRLTIAGGMLAAAVLLNLLVSWQTSGLKEFGYTAELDAHPAVEGWIDPAMTPVAFRPYRRFKEIRVDIPRAAFVEGEGSAEATLWESAHRRIQIDSERGGTVRLRTFWFPGWSATLDGAPLALSPDEALAALTAQVPPGAHAIELRFLETPVRRAGGWIGAVTALILPLFCLVLARGARGARVSAGSGSG